MISVNLFFFFFLIGFFLSVGARLLGRWIGFLNYDHYNIGVEFYFNSWFNFGVRLDHELDSLNVKERVGVLLLGVVCEFIIVAAFSLGYSLFVLLYIPFFFRNVKDLNNIIVSFNKIGGK